MVRNCSKSNVSQSERSLVTANAEKTRPCAFLHAATMPGVVVCKTVRSGYEGRANDEILQLGILACEATAAAQATPLEGRAEQLARAFDLRTAELAEWNRLGDKIGISMAQMGIGNVCFLRHQMNPLDTSNSIEIVRTWYVRAEATLDGLDDEAANKQRDVVRSNWANLELYEANSLLLKTVRVHGLLLATHYNGRTGYVQSVHSPGRYVVRLHAVGTALWSTEEHLLIRGCNLDVA